jgi:Glycosyltransferase WbsX
MSTTTHKVSLRLLMTILMSIATVIFTIFWTSVKTYGISKTQQQPPLSMLSASSTTTTTMFEYLVKENFIKSSENIPQSSKIRKQSNNQNYVSNSNLNTNSTPPLPHIWVIYFPQYHPDPLNDKNWGVNFTDWVSLQKSPLQNRLGYDIPRPLQENNNSPYYDLRDWQPRQRQGQLANRYGVDGFIYHHYWFYDRTHPGPNLAAPLLNMLKDGHPNVPFFFNWCGKFSFVDIKQHYIL